MFLATVALNYEETQSHSERFSNIKPFIDKYNWEKIDYPSKIGNWKMFEKSNLSVVLTILYTKEKEKLPAYISKHNAILGKKYFY